MKSSMKWTIRSSAHCHSRLCLTSHSFPRLPWSAGVVPMNSLQTDKIAVRARRFFAMRLLCRHARLLEPASPHLLLLLCLCLLVLAQTTAAETVIVSGAGLDVPADESDISISDTPIAGVIESVANLTIRGLTTECSDDISIKLHLDTSPAVTTWICDEPGTDNGGGCTRLLGDFVFSDFFAASLEDTVCANQGGEVDVGNYKPQGMQVEGSKCRAIISLSSFLPFQGKSVSISDFRLEIITDDDHSGSHSLFYLRACLCIHC